jgi:hypothetical protein
LKDRVRELKRNWQADGEWKESVLRTILRRHLPTDVSVGRGFVVAGGGRESGQIDILIHRNSRPVLFRDGDLVIVTPDAVCGIIEVKTEVDVSGFHIAAAKLADHIEIVRAHSHGRKVDTVNAFAALFAYECAGTQASSLGDVLVDVATSYERRINFAAVGPDKFLRYWEDRPEHILSATSKYRTGEHRSWHGYDLPSMSAGYFIHNVVEAICPDSVLPNSELWFPIDSKERSLTFEVKAQWPDSGR